MAHKLKDNALIDWEYYITFMGESTDDSNIPKDQVHLFINAASEWIENYCDRKFRDADGLVEVFDGDSEKDMYTRNRPIDEGTTSIKLEHWDGVSWDEVTSSEATRAVNTENGRVYFTDGTKFTEGEDNWRITYDYGLTLANIPSDLKQVCAIMIQRSMKSAEGKEGVVAESLIDRSVTIDLSNIPGKVLRVLDMKYRRVLYG